MIALAIGGLLLAIVAATLRPDRGRIPHALWVLLLGVAAASIGHPLWAAQAADLLEEVGVFVVLFAVGEELAEDGAHPLAGAGLAIAAVGAVALAALGLGATLALGIPLIPAIGIALAAVPTSGALAAASLVPELVPRAARRLVLQAAVGDDLISLGLLALAPIVLPTGAHLVGIAATVVAVGIALAGRHARARLRLLAALGVAAAMLVGVSPALAGALAGALAHRLLPRQRAVLLVRRGLAFGFFAAAGYLGGTLAPPSHIDLPLLAVLAAALLASRGLIATTVARQDRWVAIGMLPRGEVSIAIAIALSPVIGAKGDGVVLDLVALSTVLAVALVQLGARANRRRGGQAEA